MMKSVTNSRVPENRCLAWRAQAASEGRHACRLVSRQSHRAPTVRHQQSSALAATLSTQVQRVEVRQEAEAQTLLRSDANYFAPLEVVLIEGKGRGVVASRDLAAGELLLASTPLALVEAAPATAAASDDGSVTSTTSSEEPVEEEEVLLPVAADLSRLLRSSSLSSRQSRALTALFSGEDAATDSWGPATGPGDGSGAWGRGVEAFSSADPDLEADTASGAACLQLGSLSSEGCVRGTLLPGRKLRVQSQLQHQQQQQDSHHHHHHHRYQHGTLLRSRQQQPDTRQQLLAPDQWDSAVVFNCYGEPRADQLLEELLRLQQSAGDRGTGPGRGPSGGFVGLWPDFAMLNHSCCPNTINLVGGPHRHMLVRATEPILAGEEVTVCYFGRELLAPRSIRAAATQHTHDFRCWCSRCRFEAALGSQAEAAIRAVHERANEEWGSRVGQLAAVLQEAASRLEKEEEAQRGVAAAAKGTVGQQGATAASGGGGGAGWGWWSGTAGGGGTAAATVLRRIRGAVEVATRELRALDEQLEAAVEDATSLAAAEQPQLRLGSDDLDLDGAAATRTPLPRQWHWLRASLYDALELRVAVLELLRDGGELLERLERLEGRRARAEKEQEGRQRRPALLSALWRSTQPSEARPGRQREGSGEGAAHPASSAERQERLCEALRSCLEVVAAVAPGTTLHLHLAAQLQREGALLGKTRTGDRDALAGALVARYGRLPAKQLSALARVAQAGC